MPSRLIREARAIAARRGALLNALVQESIERAVNDEDDYSAALDRILASTKKGLYRIGKLSISRSALYRM